MIAAFSAVAAVIERLRLRRVGRYRQRRLPITDAQFLRACGLSGGTQAARAALAARSAISALSSVAVERISAEDRIWRDLIRIDSWGSLQAWVEVAEFIDEVERQLGEPLASDDAYEAMDKAQEEVGGWRRTRVHDVIHALIEAPR